MTWHVWHTRPRHPPFPITDSRFIPPTGVGGTSPENQKNGTTLLKITQLKIYAKFRLDRLKRHSQIDTFEPALIGWTMNALAVAVWRHPGLIHSIAAIPGAVGLLSERCRISLQNLLARVPNGVSTDDERDDIAKRYARPYVDNCELLLALLRLGESTSIIWPLRQGSTSAIAFSKMVRQLDARFSTAKINLRWRVQVAVSDQGSLYRMSPLAFALNSYLTEGAGGNLIQVTEIQSD